MANIIISGASAGVGRAIVRRFAEPGTRIGLIARDEDRLKKAKAEVMESGAEAIVLPADVADSQQIEACADRFENTYGAIDIWLNVAMVTVISPVSEMTPEEYKRVTDVTYLGTVNGTLSALKRMKPRNKGHIVQIGSALAYRSLPLQSAYCAAKSAVVGFTDSLRSELLHEQSGVKLTIAHLPAVNTPQFDWARVKTDYRPQPMPPVFEPELIADSIYHAAHHPKREYWIGLPTWKAILSNKLAPRLGDHLLASQGYQGQMTEDPSDPDRPDNLFETVPGNYGAHGRFGEKARARSLSVAASRHPEVLLATGAVSVAALAGGLLMMARKGKKSS